MPARIRKLSNKELYRVTDSKGHIHAKATTLNKAKAVVRIIESGRRK